MPLGSVAVDPSPGAGSTRRQPPRTRRRLAAVLVTAVAAALLTAPAGAAGAAPRSPVPAEPVTLVGATDGTVVSAQGFAHPGVLLGRAQLRLMQKKVQQQKEPWYSAYLKLSGQARAAKNYRMQGPVAWINWRSTGANQYRLYEDGMAASIQTDLWYITGDPVYRDNALGIIRAWSATLTNMSEGIHAPVGVARMTQAAEILRYTTGSGWTDADTTAYSAMLRIVMRPRAEDGSGGIEQANAWMNQAGAQLTALHAAAVFLDDRTAYDNYMYRITVGNNEVPVRDVAISRQIAPTGQVTEMGRDQGHASLDITQPAEIAQTAYLQHTLGNLGDSGVDLYEYLDRRLLKGAEYFAAFNAGHDVDWDPTIWTDAKEPAYGDRGYFLDGAGIYHHYRYTVGVPDRDMPNLARIGELTLARNLNPQTLLETTPARAASDGPDEPVDTDASVDPAFDRHGSADGITAISNPDQVAIEPYTDAYGSRHIITNVQRDGWVQYGDFDFGDTPRDTVIVRAGAKSTIGSQITMRLDSPTGEVIGVVQVPDTGYALSWATIQTKLTRAVSGTRTLVLQWSGSNNVYGWQGGLNWFTFAATSAQLANPVTTADTSTGTTTPADGPGLVFTDGAAVTFTDMNFDEGSLDSQLRIKTSAAAALEVHHGTPDGPLVTTITLPDTGGTWADVRGNGTGTALLGRQDIALVYRGAAGAVIDTVRFSYGTPAHAPTAGADLHEVVTGSARVAGKTVRLGPDSVIGYTRVDLTGRQLALTYHADRDVTVKIYANRLDSTPVATTTLDRLRHGQKRTRFVDLPAGLSTVFTFVTSTGRVTLEKLQSDPEQVAAPVITTDLDTRYFVGQQISERVTVTDPYGLATTLTAHGLPEGARFDAATGTLTWTPTAQQAGETVVDVVADNGRASVRRSLTLHVSAGADAAVDEVAATVDRAALTGQSRQTLEYAVADAHTAIAGRTIVFDPDRIPAADEIALADVLARLRFLHTTIDGLRKPFPTTVGGSIDQWKAAKIYPTTNTTGQSDSSLAAAFDGNISTSPNTVVHTTAVWDWGTSRVVPTAIRVYPRAGQATRLSNRVFQGSNDGVTWVDVARIPTITDATAVQWYPLTLSRTGTQFRYLRIYIQYFHVGEIEISGYFVDTAVLDYAKATLGFLDQADYTAGSWAGLADQVARTEALAQVPTTTQAQLDAATDQVRQAMLALTPAGTAA